MVTSPGSAALHVDLELDVGADPIQGTVRVASAERPFSGWLALITTLDALRAQADHDRRRAES